MVPMSSMCSSHLLASVMHIGQETGQGQAGVSRAMTLQDERGRTVCQEPTTETRDSQRGRACTILMVNSGGRNERHDLNSLLDASTTSTPTGRSLELLSRIWTISNCDRRAETEFSTCVCV